MAVRALFDGLGMEDDMSEADPALTSDPALAPDNDPNLNLRRKIRRWEGEGPSAIPTPEESRKAGLLRKVEDSGA